MIRDVVKIEEDLCNGCGLCVPGCHEGALQIIDGKARLVSELMCDGLGACLGHCPQGAITIEKREAEQYNETKVMEIMAGKGKNTVLAHLNHLKEHNETDYLREGVKYLLDHEADLAFEIQDVIDEIRGDQPKVRTHINLGMHPAAERHHEGGGCPGSRAVSFENGTTGNHAAVSEQASELRHWPVQLHLVNPAAPYYRKADVVIASDCSAFTVGNFHARFLKGKSLAIACPKLDSQLEIYVDKFRRMMDEAQVNTLTVIIMEVPCCGGLLQMVMNAAQQAKRKVPVKAIKVSMQGDVLSEGWM